MTINEKALEAGIRAGIASAFNCSPSDDTVSNVLAANKANGAWAGIIPTSQAAITAYLSAIEGAGFVVVPVDPTEAMRAAGDGAIDQYESRHLILAEDREAMAVAAYGAMLAAKDAR